MAQFSTYKNLELPDSPERYNIQVFNKNNMVIDSELNRLDLKDKSQDELLATKESLNSEISRASEMETSIIQNLDAEIARASEVEKDLSDNIFDETERSIAAENNIRESLSNHINDELNPHKVTPAQLNLENVNNTADMDKPVSTAQQNAIDSILYQSNHYTDAKIAELTGGAPETLNTLKEVADAIQKQESMVDAINAAIGKKADAAEVSTHIGNTTLHVTASERTAWNNKLDKIGDASNVTTTFTTASALTVLTSKEKLSISLGKLTKAISTLISHIATTATASVAGHVKVDTALSATSTNPVQNKAVQAKIASLQSSFQAGCDSLYDKCVLLGVTPLSKTPEAITAAMDLIYKKGWNDAPKGMKSYHSLGESNYKSTFTYQITYGEYPDLDLLTADDFILILKGIRGASGTAGNGVVVTRQPTISYIYDDSKGYGEVKVTKLNAYPAGQTGSYGLANVEVGFFQ